ncbi:hypothetical protein HJC23_013825 [Cyclotella cryptica]|uniref:Uncharacterized protein n=1 Tax=Cyclotella cryptica TaxID=29204 RepID=A0ABD3PBR4_9STRA
MAYSGGGTCSKYPLATKDDWIQIGSLLTSSSPFLDEEARGNVDHYTTPQTNKDSLKRYA